MRAEPEVPVAERTAIVVTSIAAPNRAMADIAAGSRERGWDFIVIGDVKSPSGFALEGCRYFDIPSQTASGLRFAEMCPTGHYARKNVGYLLAMGAGARLIIETDDDNFPSDGFWRPRRRELRVATVRDGGWVNVYRYFTEARIWPRGLPLDSIDGLAPAFDALPVGEVDCPVQQGLADADPDVDAIYRMTLPLPQSFRGDRRVAMAEGTWCPFNSQNTAWWPEAFPLMYLPAHCPFRMTDIWRSFVAQRIAWTNGWSVLFHEPTVRQERNVHDLMHDFADEVPGYLNNRRIGEALADLALEPGGDAIPDNIRRCYQTLVAMGLVKSDELDLIEAWFADLAEIRDRFTPVGRDP